MMINTGTKQNPKWVNAGRAGEKRKGSTCKKCGVYIEWLKTEKGKDMPIDPAEVTIVTEEGKTIRGFIPHWVTCPNADDFRKK